jgi:hypothetical protein
MNYQLTERDMILRLDDHIFIPPDPQCRGYREYLAWLAEGNEPLPADES